MALEILNAKKVEANGLLSKIQIGGKTYEVKDVIARESIESISADLAALSYIQKDGVFESDTKIKEYVDAQVGSINKFDVVIGVAGDDGKPNVAASADTMYKLYLIQNADSAAGEYVEYITIRSGEEGNYTYTWEAIGSTKMSLTGYVTETALQQALVPYQLKSELGALAKKDSAAGTVAGETISGVKATGQSAGSITVELEQSEHAMNSTGKFTPAGNVTGTVAVDGEIAVTAKYAAADATLTKGDYTPAGTVSADFTHAATPATLTKADYTPAGEVSVALSGATFNAITGVGTQASFKEGAFTAATLDYAAADYSVAKEGIVGSVDDNETLVFTAAGLEAISASKINAFNGGSKAADEFTANSLPTMAEQVVGVQSASFTGTKAAEALVTGVSYDKAALANLAFAGTKAEGALVTGVSYQKADIDAATFTGKTVDIAATFAGTEADVAVAGTCHDYAVKTAQFNPAAVELAVGDIVVAAKDVTVQ